MLDKRLERWMIYTYPILGTLRGGVNIACEQFPLSSSRLLRPEARVERRICVGRFGCFKILAFLDQPFHLITGHLLAAVPVDVGFARLVLTAVVMRTAGSAVMAPTFSYQDRAVLALHAFCCGTASYS
jgi:hypothetical protein